MSLYNRSTILAVMSKPPEQGEIWEWRAFGAIGDRLSSEIRKHPVRMNVLNDAGEDLYLVSPVSEQNIKLRRWQYDWVLKIKLLLTSGPRGMELYSETAGMVFTFPIAKEVLKQVARLLAVKLPDGPDYGPVVTQNEFIIMLTESSPANLLVPVIKTRSQFDFGDGWVELADVKFPDHLTQSISVHSRQIPTVEGILNDLQPNSDLEVMNYVQACRRWGSH